MTTRGLLFRQAFLEYKETRQISTGNGAMYVAMVEYGGRVPGGFIRDELGYDGTNGVRLDEFITKKAIENRHLAAAAAEQQFVAAPDISPKPAKAPRETRQSRRAKLDQLALMASAHAIGTRYAVVGQ